MERGKEERRERGRKDKKRVESRYVETSVKYVYT